MSQDLLKTKLYIPPARKNLVSRPSLLQMLDGAWREDKKLVLISAPAGYGKTTLAAEWLRRLDAKAAWLSLEAADNDPARFLAYLIAALQGIDAHIGENTRAMLRSPQPLPVEVVLTALINEIAAVSAPFTLALDDYHIIQALQIHQQLDFLVEHVPPQMCLVIISREDPPLPLARLRARNQMLEIRQADLRFTLAECADFLQRVMGFELTLADVDLLETRTEGWIAGLQLAALSMQDCDDLPGFIQAFSGSSHYVLEYLIEEVFDRQSAVEQEFLLKTSILDRLCGPLCDQVADRAGSLHLLNHLEHTNLFIIPLDQSRTWYRYHQLFAELLRQRLRAAGTFSETELHRLASRWFQAEGFLPEAIHHALVASDWDNAAEMIQSNSVQMLTRGELVTLLGWLKALPDEVIYARPQLSQNYGWALTLTGRIEAADLYLQQAETLAGDNPALLGPVLVARSYHLRVSGDNPRAIAYARRALSILQPSDALSIGLAALTLGLAYWNDGSFQESERAFLEVDRAAQLSGNHYARMVALTYLAMIQGVYGHLHRAGELCEQVIQLGGRSPTVASAHIELATLFYEWNDLDRALEHAQSGVEQSLRTGNPLLQNDAYRILAIIQQARRQPEAALLTLQKADQLADGHQVSALSIVRIAACHVQVALAQDDLASAQYWAERATGPTDSSFLYTCLGLTPVRIHLARHEKAEAAQKLVELYEIAQRKDCGAGLVEARLLQSLAADTPDDALQFLQDALHKAESEGMIRTFIDKGDPMKALLERLKTQGGGLKPYILTLLAAFGNVNASPKPQPIVEPLSERELEVLRLMANGLANHEIAARLIISVGTAKSHVHHILEKLGGSSRSQAVARARELGLL